MTQRQLPGLGLTGYWPLGYTGWKTGMDENLRVLSFRAHGSVVSRSTAIPADDSSGDLFIVPSGAGANPDEIAVWDGEPGAEQWEYYPAKEGWEFYVEDSAERVRFVGGAWVIVNAAAAEPFELMFAMSDETTPITVGDAKITLRMPTGITLTAVRADLVTPSTTGAITIDIKKGGVSILSTLLTIDATEDTSETAAVPAVISDDALADNAKITADIVGAGSSADAAGLKVTLIGNRA